MITTLYLFAAATAVSALVTLASPTIDKTNREWESAIRAGDAAILARPYAEDGVFVGADGQSLRGRDAVERMYAARSSSSNKIVSARIHSLGRLAIGPDQVCEWGKGELGVRSADGKVTLRSGRYLTVWRRGRAGQWEIVRNLAF